MEVPLQGHDGSLAKSVKERGVAAAREEGWARRNGLHDLHEGGPCVSTAASSAANQGGATHAPGPIVAPRFRPWSRLVLRPTATATPPSLIESQAPDGAPSTISPPSIHPPIPTLPCPARSPPSLVACCTSSSTPSFLLACPCSPQILGAWSRLTRAAGRCSVGGWEGRGEGRRGKEGGVGG